MFKFQVRIDSEVMARFALAEDAYMFCNAFTLAYPDKVITVEDRNSIYARFEQGARVY